VKWPSISAVILAYNEAENLRTLLPAIRQRLSSVTDSYEIIVVDSPNSSDTTAEVCQSHGVKYILQESKGYGGAFKTGIKYALNDTILVLDADWSHDPKEIRPIYELFTSGKYDLVIGSRYTRGGVSNDTRIARMMSKLLNTTMRMVIGVRATDISNGYRLYDNSQLRPLQLQSINYDILQEVIMKMKINNPELRIGESPITFNKRLFGESKRDLWEFVKSYIKTAGRLLKLRFCQP